MNKRLFVAFKKNYFNVSYKEVFLAQLLIIASHVARSHQNK